MNFLLEHEEQATLAEALAFIDSFPLDAADDTESSGGSHDDAASDSSASRHAPTSPASAVGSSSSSSGNSADDKRVLAARARNTRAVNQYRKRSKTEILRLRDEVRLLDARLGQLRANAAVSSAESLARAHAPPAIRRRSLRLQPCPVGIDAAVAELRQLEKSEALNRRLKEALRKQRKVSNTLESLFRKEMSKNDLTFVVDLEKTLQPKAPQDRNALAPWDEAVVFGDLSRYVRDTVYSSTPGMLALINRGDVDCAFHNTLVKHDVRAGKMLQFMANTPVFCSVQQLDDTIWRFLGGPTLSTDTGRREELRFKFDCKLSDVCADGVSVGRRVVEPHRTVHMYTSLISPRGSGLLFRETMWMVLSDAAASGCTTAPTLFQAMYRLHVEPPGPSSNASGEPVRPPLEPGLAALHEFVLDRQGEKTRRFQVTVQDHLLRHDGAAPPAHTSYLASCTGSTSA
ncbi:hypothetical protein PybrP1_003642 [[Pythium] brassicae (nom. inval.)]|nr:hypothetical protein PybrP1_003642 [[Pythium] brassicae (nom. inval.)]